jgi:hypothetical protein
MSGNICLRNLHPPLLKAREGSGKGLGYPSVVCLSEYAFVGCFADWIGFYVLLRPIQIVFDFLNVPVGKEQQILELFSYAVFGESMIYAVP